MFKNTPALLRSNLTCSYLVYFISTKNGANYASSWLFATFSDVFHSSVRNSTVFLQFSAPGLRAHKKTRWPPAWDCRELQNGLKFATIQRIDKPAQSQGGKAHCDDTRIEKLGETSRQSGANPYCDCRLTSGLFCKRIATCRIAEL